MAELTQGQQQAIARARARARAAGKQESPEVQQIRADIDAQIARDYPKRLSGADKVGMDMGLEGGGAAAGQVIGGTLAGPAGVVAGGALFGGAGNAVSQYRQMASGDRDKFSWGEVGGAAMAAAVPGAALAKAPVKAVLKEGAKQAAGNIVAKEIETKIDDGRHLSGMEMTMAGTAGALGTGAARFIDTGAAQRRMAEKQGQREVVDRTIAEARAAGYILVPSQVNPSGLNKVMESIAGKAATMQDVAIRNQEITNNLARKAIGLPTDAPITKAALDGARAQAGQVYEQVASISPKAAKTLLALREARAERTLAYDYFNASKKPSAQIEAKKLDKLTDKLEADLEGFARANNQPELIDQLRAARQRIAKIYDVERSLELSTGDVDAKLLASLYDKQRPLTGDLRGIGQFSDFSKGGTRLPSTVPTPGVGQLHPVLASAFGVMGYQYGGAPGAMAGAAAPWLASTGARNMLLSSGYQDKFATQLYKAAVPQDFGAQVVRLGVQGQGR